MASPKARPGVPATRLDKTKLPPYLKPLILDKLTLLRQNEAPIEIGLG